MYRCEMCGAIVPPETRPVRIVLTLRPRAYPFRVHAHRDPKTHRLDGKQEPLTWQEVVALFAARRREHKREQDPCDDPGGSGYEIVKEAAACPSCATTYCQRPPLILRE
jgi:hypothetical protein